METNLNYSELEPLAKKISKLNPSDLSKELIALNQELSKLDNLQVGLSEIYRQEFSFYWNNEQSDLFFSKNILTPFPDYIVKTPSLWTEKWKFKTQKKLVKSNINLEGIRNFDFSETVPFIENLQHIIQHVYKNDPKQADIYFSCVPDNHTYKEITDVKNLQLLLLKSIYLSAGIISFSTVLETRTQQHLFNKITEIHFDKQLKTNSSVFQYYAYAKNTTNKSQTDSFKKDFFIPTPNDLKFISFWNKHLSDDIIYTSISNLVTQKELKEEIISQFKYALLKNELSFDPIVEKPKKSSKI